MRPSLAARQTLIRKPASRAGSLQTKLGLITLLRQNPNHFFASLSQRAPLALASVLSRKGTLR